MTVRVRGDKMFQWRGGCHGAIGRSTTDKKQAVDHQRQSSLAASLDVKPINTDQFIALANLFAFVSRTPLDQEVHDVLIV